MAEEPESLMCTRLSTDYDTSSPCVMMRRSQQAMFSEQVNRYTFTHAGRKMFSNVKTAMGSTWLEADITPDAHYHTESPLELTNFSSYLPKVDPFLDSVEEVEVFFGMLDTTFLLSYAFGLYFGGVVGDRVDLRIFLAQGMVISAIMLLMFGSVSEWMHAYSRIYYLTFWILNGLSQGYSWPALVAVMGNWFGYTNRGLIFGIWSSSSAIGNLLGAGIVYVFIGYGYEYCFLVSSVLMIIWGVVILLFLHPSPDSDSEKLETKCVDMCSLMAGTCGPANNDKKAIGLISAILLPGVIMYSVSYCFLKMVNYSLMFWLPFYLNNNFGYEELKADKLSMFYDVGGTFGGPFIGWLSDLTYRRSPAVIAGLALSMLSLIVYNTLPGSEWMNAVGMTGMGFLVVGTAHIVSSAVPADIGQQEQISGDRSALSTVTGIIDGTGTIGAAVGQAVIPLFLVSIGADAGWNAVFYFLAAMTGFAILSILAIFIRDVRAICCSGDVEDSTKTKINDEAVMLTKYDAIAQPE